jgi:thiol:disulfide interchange protein
MINRISGLIILCITAALLSQAQVHFENSDIKTTSAKARRLNKSLFFFFYTDWSIPCRKVPKTVFTERRIRAAIDSQYVSMKFNAEKGPGRAIAKRYGVGGLPTFLFADGDGKEIGRIVGARSNDDYLVAIRSRGRTDPLFDRLQKKRLARDTTGRR